jgi:hypothetical protein
LHCAFAAACCSVGKYLSTKKKKDGLKADILEQFGQVDDELTEITGVLERAKKKQQELLQRRQDMQGDAGELPNTWSVTADPGQILVELDAKDTQYWDVSDQLRATMPDGWISQLWRVQNKPLWNFFCFHKRRLAQNSVLDNGTHLRTSSSASNTCHNISSLYTPGSTQEVRARKYTLGFIDRGHQSGAPLHREKRLAWLGLAGPCNHLQRHAGRYRSQYPASSASQLYF